MQKNSKTKQSILYMIKKYLDLKTDIEVERNDTIKIKPPYLILPNHTNNLDPFFVSAFINRPVEFVTSDEYFRKFINRYFLNYTGAIPKKKFVSDSSVIREILTRIKNRKIIGIFPEGKRSWDGTTDKVIYSTAKLIKLLKIPVIITTLKGANLSHPRWAEYNRRGKIIISYKLIFNKREIKELSTAKIYEDLQNSFVYDEYEFQASRMNIYQGKRMAENLEILLFTCPNCLSAGKMISKDNKLYCSNCNYSVLYNKYGCFENTGNKLYHKNPRDWNQWQLKILKYLIFNNDLQLSDNNIELIKFKKQNKARKIDIGELNYYNNLFSFKGKNELFFKPDKISGLNVQYNNILEFYYDKELIRFIFNNKKVSAYKWVKTLQFLNQTN